MQIAHLILRAAMREEADRLLAFYESNPDRFLLPRPSREFAASVDRGQFFVITHNEEIIAASGVFDYAGALPFVELAETFVSPDFRGFGIQSVFFKIRIASVILYQGPSVGITTAIDKGNEPSVRTMRQQGFGVWTAPNPEVYTSCETCPNKSTKGSCCCDFYLLPVDKAREAVRDLLEQTAPGFATLDNRKGESINLKCECTLLMGEQRQALIGFAAGEVW